MEWLNLHTSVLDSAEFLHAEPTQRATWLCLQRYCIGQENSGRIIGAKSWKDRIWQQLCRVTIKEIQDDCGLWSWEGDDLLVAFYNLESERKVQRLRGQAASAGHASWNKRSSPQGEPTAEPYGSNGGSGLGDAKGKERKGNGREGNEIPPTPKGSVGQVVTQPKGKRTLKPGSVIPSEQPEPLRERMLAVGALMRRQERTPWAAGELAALQAARLHDCSAADFESQLEPLRAYYHATIPREIDYRRRDLLTLLNHWPGELDRARAFNRNTNDGIQKL